MSRVGKKPIALPSGVTITVDGGEIKAKGPKGQLARAVPPLVELDIGGDELTVRRVGDDRRSRAMHGLARALIQNMVTGVSTGFIRELEINGVGYRADTKGGTLNLALGYSHPIEVLLPEGVEAKVERNKLVLSGIDKEVLGQLAAVVRAQRGPEPYKGKGIKYMDEEIRRKVGKAGIS